MADERDPKVSQRYRSLGGEEPSRELDQSILAAARRAADKPHAPLVTPAGRHRWYFAFGAAAILVLAVAVTMHVERERPDPEAVLLKDQVPPQAPLATEAPAASETPAAKEAPRAAARVEPKKQARPARDGPPAAPQPTESAVQPRDSAELARADPLEVRQEQTPRAEAQNAPAAAPLPKAESRFGVGGAVSGYVDRTARSRAADSGDIQPPSAPQAAPARRAQESPLAAVAVPLTPERLLERIAELRTEGRHNEADQALAEFRQRYPDYRISAEMLQKVERKK